MVKSLEETVAERRNYVEQARASFQSAAMEQPQTNSLEDSDLKFSTLGIRIVIALLLFAAFVYCDQEKITFQGYGVQDVIQQLEWNPLPTETLENLLENMEITTKPLL